MTEINPHIVKIRIIIIEQVSIEIQKTQRVNCWSIKAEVEENNGIFGTEN